MKNSKKALWNSGAAILGVLYAASAIAQDGKSQSIENVNRNLTGPGVVSTPAKQPVKVQPARNDAGAALKPGGQTVRVDGVQFKGATVFSSAQLFTASGARLNQTYDLKGLQNIADAITAHYRESGYLVARAWLAPQAIQDNVVSFQIYEGHLSKVEPFRISSRSSEVDKERVQQIARQNLCQDEDCASKPLTQERVDRAALLVTEITGYQVKGELVPGKEIGTTTMVMAVSPRSAVNPGAQEGSVGALTAPRNSYAVEVSVDNFGTQATGTNRAQARLAVSDMFQDGDQLGASYMTTNKTDIKNYSLDYSIALGYGGWRAGAGVSKTQYTLASGYGGFAGDAQTANLSVSYPIIRSSEKNIDFRIDNDHTQLSDESAAPENRKLNLTRVGLSGDFQDFGVMDLGATTTWGVTATSSNLKYDDGRSAATTTTVGTHNKYTGRIYRNQSVDNTGWYVDGNVYGQKATGNLDSYSKLYLGGASAVRAYAGGEAGGDTALVGQFSLGKTWAVNYAGQGMQTGLAAFYDRGWAHLQEDPTTGVTNNQVNRSGWGLEAKLSKKDNYALRTFWAKGNSGPSAVDGKKSRIGLSLGLAF